VEDLAVSRDGALLAAGLAKGGVRVWDAHNGKPVFADEAYAGPVRRVAFGRDGTLFTTAADGAVRHYDAAGKLVASVRLPGGLHPWGLAVSPDGGLVAVTADSRDRAGRLLVEVLSAARLAHVVTPDTAGLSGEGLLAVAWAADADGGTKLLAGGYAHGPDGYVIRAWADYGLGPATDTAVGGDTVRDIVPVPGGGAVFATEDPGWGRLARDGGLALRPRPPIADLRPSRGALAVSDDGMTVGFATPSGSETFAVRRRSLAPGNDATLHPARAEAPRMALAGWRDSDAPALNGRRLALEPGDFARSAAIAPDARTVVLGTDTSLRLYGADGMLLATAPVPAAAWAVAYSGDGKSIVAALLDGTLRWFGAGDRLAPRGGVFLDADLVRWVMFTPEGVFDDSDRGGSDLVGLELDRAANQAPLWLSFAQAYRALYAPDAVQARLSGDPAPARARMAELGDLAEALAQQPQVAIHGACVVAGGQPGRGIVAASNACHDIALGGIATLPEGAGTLRLSLAVTDHGRGLGPLDVFVDGRNALRVDKPQPDAPFSVQVPLDPGTDIVTVRQYDAGGVIYGESPALRLRPAAEAGKAGRGRLFVLAIGIDHYANPSLTLHFADADARTFTDIVRQGAAPLFASVDMTLLLDRQATKAGILAAFDRLAGIVRPEDTFLFYVASHGVRDEETNRFLMIPADMKDISSWKSMAAQAIDEGTLVAALARIQARDALLFVDTCHSGKLTLDNLANLGHETGRYLLTASTSVQEALDSYDNRNGVFVYAVREALEGKAGADAQGDIGALSLGEYVSQRVGVLARRRGHQQDAVFRAAQTDLRSFPIAKVISQAK
jgi:Caspase domain/WD domain, G-beta repeat